MQFGGFCAYGISSEVCPKFGWSPSCMGPYGNWNHWTIHDEKLYFFGNEKSKALFVSDIDNLVEVGDARWRRWYSIDKSAPIATNCVETAR